MRKVNTLLSRPKYKLVKAFQSAESADKMLKTLQKMDLIFKESELGVECYLLAGQLLTEDRPPEQVLSFGNRALRIFNDNATDNIPCFGDYMCASGHNPSFYIASVCNLLASASLKLKRFNECFSYLNWSNRNLSKLLEAGEDDTSCHGNCLMDALLANHKELFYLKLDTGWYDESVLHLRKVLEIQEGMMEKDCIEIGNTYVQLSSMYSVIMSCEEALPFCLKALQIFTKHFGGDSVEIVELVCLLVELYNELGEYEKSLEKNQLLRNILTSDSPKLLDAEAYYGDILIGLGKYKEAICVLKRVVSHTDTEEVTRASAFIISMSRACCYLKKFADVNRYMRTAQRLYEKQEDHVCIAMGFREISVLYEKINDFENAISMLRRVLSIPEIPRKLLAESSARIFSLISRSGKKEEGTVYMEDVVEKLKEKFGVEHCEVGHGYRNLGATYLKSGQEQLAVMFMVKAKEIMDVILGPHHLDSLKTSQTLAETYVTLSRYDLAIETQQKVVESLEYCKPREQEFLDMAVELLDKMKESRKISYEGLTQSKDENDLCDNLICVISDDGKVL